MDLFYYKRQNIVYFATSLQIVGHEQDELYKQIHKSKEKPTASHCSKCENLLNVFEGDFLRLFGGDSGDVHL